MSVSIYQTQYSDDVVGKFDPAFIKYDCRAYPESTKREIAHMQRLFAGYEWQHNVIQYVGLVSPKFNDKSKLSGNEFIGWINNNPGYDVYFVNPFPQLQYLHFNVWEQGEYWHSGLIKLADYLFELADLNIQTKILPRNNTDTLLYCNYWVANERFWREYMEFISKLTSVIDNLPTHKQNLYYAQAQHYAPATYYPFIFERMFSTFITIDKRFSCLSYQYPKDELLLRCTNDIERHIVAEWSELIDSWDAFDRKDNEVRKIFINLENLQKLYSVLRSTSADGPSTVGSYRLISQAMRLCALCSPKWLRSTMCRIFISYRVGV